MQQLEALVQQQEHLRADSRRPHPHPNSSVVSERRTVGKLQEAFLKRKSFQMFWAGLFPHLSEEVRSLAVIFT